MASNPFVNKVVKNGTVVIDLTGDDVTASDVAAGVKFHLPSGAQGTGTSTLNADVSDDTATASDVLSGSTFHAGNGDTKTGSMTNNGSVDYVIDDVNDELVIAAGYHDGGGRAKLSPTEKGKVIPENIKDGVVLFNVTGTYTGEGVTAQAKTATPTFAQQVITPDSGYDYLSQVTVAAIPETETDNAQGGKTLTIG